MEPQPVDILNKKNVSTHVKERDFMHLLPLLSQSLLDPRDRLLVASRT
jgi:hypothetical protein